MSDINPKDQKQIMKEAIKEWMDERYAEVGKWFIKSILIAGVTSLLYYYIVVRGYKFP